MADQDEDFSVELFGCRARGGARLSVARFDLSALRFEELQIVIRRTERFALREEKVTRKARADGDDVANRAQVFDAFK